MPAPEDGSLDAEDALALGESEPEAEPKLSPVARMRREQEAERKAKELVTPWEPASEDQSAIGRLSAEEEEWKAGRSEELVRQQTIARVIFVLGSLATGFFVRRAILNDDTSERPQSASSGPSFKLPEIKFSPPTARNGYEDRTDIGKVRPLFRPEESNIESP